MPHHATAAAWTELSQRRWFARCDQCRRWRLVHAYFEVYPPLGGTAPSTGWWWACADCLVGTIGGRIPTLAGAGLIAELEEFAEASRQAARDWQAGGRKIAPWPVVRQQLGIPEPNEPEPPAISLTAVGQDWCEQFEPGPDGEHCETCRYPAIGHGNDYDGYRAHRRDCKTCQEVRVVALGTLTCPIGYCKRSGQPLVRGNTWNCPACRYQTERRP